jgi:hypothetical protein
MTSHSFKPLVEQTVDYVGKTSFVLTFVTAFLSKLQVAQVNEILTIIISGITLIYVVFRALNEIKRFRKKSE